ncbi:L-aspartate oxidase [Caldimicrobium thiodismutans]|uniref:L-aspartate oxidase n=1 Tax=Caldimicrobium thiodismutans TaxID=1653476 RepID=A0A0U5AXS5_9BACT|nr:L-aspartate oxidase [Caldimicrobium thiodismutans]BAU23247.1 L-aspartate oxidase [Caldimicrobium thiodismutans]
MEIIKTDFLIIGSGIAGLSLALKLKELGEVTILTKKRIFDTATALAQGGIACVLREDNHFDLHIQDTLIAGDGLCNPEVVKLVIKSAPERIQELLNWGVPFDRDPENPGRFHLTLEGGHSRKRILHVGDYTGRAIERALVERALEAQNIVILENHFAVELILDRDCSSQACKVAGAYVLDLHTPQVKIFLAPIIALCTGGAGKVYLYTSNPDTATGDGLALAYRVGVTLANMEFFQFHPTCLYHPKAKNFLISEALRGEGGILLNPEGKPFMQKYDPLRKELAPRDIVTRAIDMELKSTGGECVFLDMTHLPSDYIKKRFPYIYETCLKFGIDITAQPIPVVPAAHYLCGGIRTNSHAQTDIFNLFAIGECACTGLHGANRLASNSLLEALVFSHQAYLKIREIFPQLRGASTNLPKLKTPEVKEIREEKVFISHNWDLIRKIMWDFVGIVRSLKMLDFARRRISFIQEEIENNWGGLYLDLDVMELKNICIVADLMVKSALSRRESRGTHYLLDFPHKSEEWAKDTLISAKF